MVKTVLFSIFVAIATAAPAANPLQVETTSGTVEGHLAKWPVGSTVVEFLGIPYAQPPTGDLRFAAPKAYSSNSSAVFKADKYSADCVQYTGAAASNDTVPPALAAYGYAMGGGSSAEPHTYSEDCLTINVWSKEGGAGGNITNRAVMMWIYGGAFSTGTSNAPFYNGGRLAQDEDVVVVSFNYRINIFGFSLAPGLEQNVGLLDQRLAVEWVRDNIAAFGGDPSRITLFGESAGGSSVDLYSFAWTQDPIVNAFIEQSGTVSLAGTAPVDNSAWYNITSALGCGGADVGEATVACMRQQNATAIINAVGASTGGGVQTPFEPAADEVVVFSDTPARSAAGNFIKRPLLVGANDFEVGIIRGLGSSSPLSFGPITPDSPDSLLQLATEAAFGCPAATAAWNRTSAGVPAWRYRYMAVWDNVALAPRMGAYHSSEIPIALGTNPLRPNSTVDVPEEAALEKLMMFAWAEFARDPEKGLSALGWPKYVPDGNTLIRLGYNNQSAVNIANSTMYDSQCGMFTT